MCSKVIVFTDDAALKQLLAKHDIKPRLITWLLLLQEFNIKRKDRKGDENLGANHLSRICNEYTNDLVGFSDHFPDEQLFAVSHASFPLVC